MGIQKWLVGLISLLVLVAEVSAQEIDAATGLIIDDNYELVKTNCTVCHSAQNIIRQSGSRLTWLGLIRWMQATQGLQEFSTDTENKILGYLETNYGPKEISYRRAPIPPFLMPPNPYLTQATLKFVGLEEIYQVGDILKVEVAVDFQESYSKGRLDLWIAVHVPNTPASQFLFITAVSDNLSFSLEPQPFQDFLEALNGTYKVLMDFTVPVLEAGEYVFYALLVEAGANPLQEANRNRSELAVQVTTVGKE